MKYTFYRCFTRFLSAPRSPKLHVPTGHSPWTSVKLGEEEGIKMRCLAPCAEGSSTEPAFVCLAFVHLPKHCPDEKSTFQNRMRGWTQLSLYSFHH